MIKNLDALVLEILNDLEFAVSDDANISEMSQSRKSLLDLKINESTILSQSKSKVQFQIPLRT